MGDYGFVLGDLGERRTAASPEAGSPFYQTRLAAFVKALVDAYGWRPDVIGTNIPYLPAPFAEAMLRFYYRHTREILERPDIPEDVKRPELLRKLRDDATAHLGEVRMGNFIPNTAFFEKAPPDVAAKAAGYFSEDLPAGQPSDTVVRGDKAWLFLDGLDKLAIQLDKSLGVLDPLETILKADREVTRKLSGGVRSGLESLADFPRKHFFDPLRKTLGSVAIAAFALAALYVVSRR